MLSSPALRLALLLTVVSSPGALAAEIEQTERSTQPGQPPAPSQSAETVTRQAVCTWAKRAPVLDGRLDDSCWKDAMPITRFASYWANDHTPRPGTTAYLVWDADALYYAARMSDAELKSYGKARNDTLWDGDVFELFFKPRKDRPQYYEFQANPRGLVFEVAFPERGHDFGDLHAIDPLGSKAVITLDGTLDQPGDIDKSWTVEARIPWSAFAMTGGKPRPGDEWSFALCRYDYGRAGTAPILMSSAPLTKRSFHRHEDYGTLRFAGPSAPGIRAKAD